MAAKKRKRRKRGVAKASRKARGTTRRKKTRRKSRKKRGTSSRRKRGTVRRKHRRTAAQKAATARMIAANRARRGIGDVASHMKASMKRGTRKAAKKLHLPMPEGWG